MRCHFCSECTHSSTFTVFYLIPFSVKDIFDDLVKELVAKRKDNGSTIWLNRSELNRLKVDEAALSIYNLKSNRPGLLLNHYHIEMEQIRFVKEYEFEIGQQALESLLDSDGPKVLNSEDYEYVISHHGKSKENGTKHTKNGTVKSVDDMDHGVSEEKEDKISLYFELRKKMMIPMSHKRDDGDDEKEMESDFECYLWLNLILLPEHMEKVKMQCAVYCDDLGTETSFDPVWASKDSDNVGGLVLDRTMTHQLHGLPSLTFNVTLRVLETEAMRSAAKSILTAFQ